MSRQEKYLEQSYPEFYKQEYDAMPKFDATFGVGHVFLKDGKKCTSMLYEKTRTVYFKIHSWVGISGGAIHVYGKLYTNDLPYRQEGDSLHTTRSSNMCPDCMKGIEIDVRRPLPQAEFDEYPDRYKHYRPGAYIPGYLDEKELIKDGKKLFKKFFIGDWKLKIED